MRADVVLWQSVGVVIIAALIAAARAFVGVYADRTRIPSLPGSGVKEYPAEHPTYSLCDEYQSIASRAWDLQMALLTPNEARSLGPAAKRSRCHTCGAPDPDRTCRYCGVSR